MGKHSELSVAGHGGQLAVGSLTTGGEALGAPPWVAIGVLTTRSTD